MKTDATSIEQGDKTMDTTQEALPAATNNNNGVIIVDSCGSNDFFGNLTVIALYIRKEEFPWFKLQDDHKRHLEYPDIEIAAELEKHCRYETVCITPEGYNRNVMSAADTLAWAYSKAVENLLGHINCRLVYCKGFITGDQRLSKYFDITKKAKQSLFVPEEKINCEFAKSSAGILAIRGYICYLIGLRNKYGIYFPKGINGSKVDRAIKRFIEERSYEELRTIGKLDIKNTEQFIRRDTGVLTW